MIIVKKPMGILKVEMKGKIFVHEVGTGPKIREIFRGKFDHIL